MSNTVNVKFRPLEPASLELVMANYEKCGSDPVKNYGQLMSGAMVAAAMLGLTTEQMQQQTEVMFEMAQKAVAKRTDIFGKK